MSIESALTTHLNTELAAHSLLTGIDVPVHPHMAPQSADYPFIVYSIISTNIDNNLGAGSSALTQTFFDLSVFSDTVEQRALIVEALRDILHNHSGELGTEALLIRKSFLNNISTFSEADVIGTDEQIYRASMAVTITYNWS